MQKNRQNEKDRRMVSKKIRATEMDVMSSHKPSESAQKAFRRPAYQTISVTEYMAKKYGIGGDAGGQEKAETVQSTFEGAGDQ